MAAAARLICSSEALVDGGKGVRFATTRHGCDAQAFVIRFRGQVYGYYNECGHIPAELDWLPGEFFDDSRLYLICSIHGALYAPETGRCLGGRCQGKGLKPLQVREFEGNIYLEPESHDG